MFLFKRKPHAAPDVPERFRVMRSTLVLDRLMTCVIVGGGLLVIAAVLGMFVFIFAEVVPLFRPANITERAVTASVTHRDSLSGLNGSWICLGPDPGGVAFLHPDGCGIVVVNMQGLLPGERLTSARADLHAGLVIAGTDRGRILLRGGGLTADVEIGSGSVTDLQMAFNDDIGMVAAVCAKRHLLIHIRENRMTGETITEVTPMAELAGFEPERAALAPSGDALLLLRAPSDLLYYDHDEEGWTLCQTLALKQEVRAIEWIFGGNSLVTGGQDGSLCLYSIFPHPDGQGRIRQLLGKTKEFKPLGGSVQWLASSRTDRNFIAASSGELFIAHATTGQTRITKKLDLSGPNELFVDEGIERLAVSGGDGRLQLYAVDNRHAEASLKGLLGKVWYEGYPAPEWQWQSVGGADSYEPKLSLVPLMFGTVKGTLYSLLFAVPIALLAAAYTSHFMPARIKALVKPTMEIMASLPSVVLGFLAALYVAPLMEDKVPALICMTVLIPLSAVALGFVWAARPVAVRNRYGRGIEYLVMLVMVALLAWFCWAWLGDAVEPLLVGLGCLLAGVTPGPDIATFPDLWRNAFGLAYEQRNSLVVGFIMGFAVIPVIFTIAEDALSNVPPSLVSASEALGASRWQVFRTVVLPVAAAGIFSALMIGFGRAVGETMIVLMATGNTPVMDWNIFNGMRTLSANIATELPEAAEHSTHYRVLFLCAFVLFVITFILNTASEILRNRLRERYKIV